MLQLYLLNEKDIAQYLRNIFSRDVIFSVFILSWNKPTEISWTFNDPTLSWIPSIPPRVVAKTKGWSLVGR